MLGGGGVIGVWTGLSGIPSLAGFTWRQRPLLPKTASRWKACEEKGRVLVELSADASVCTLQSSFALTFCVFCSDQLKMIFIRSEKPICAPPSLSEVSPTSPLKRFQLFVWLAVALSRPFKKDCLALPLSRTPSPRRSMVWCPWLCARMYCLKLLNTSDLTGIKPLDTIKDIAYAMLEYSAFGVTDMCCPETKSTLAHSLLLPIQYAIFCTWKIVSPFRYVQRANVREMNNSVCHGRKYWYSNSADCQARNR